MVESKSMKRFYFILMVVGLLILVDSAFATVVYQGKSSDIFEARSSTVAHQDKLNRIIAGIGSVKGQDMLQIQLTLATFVAPGEEIVDLAEERCQVLKDAILSNVSAVKVACKTQGIPLKVSAKDIDQMDSLPPHPVDRLVLEIIPLAMNQADGASQADASNSPESLEPWQKELRKRYEAIFARHGKCEVFNDYQECEEDCGQYNTAGSKPEFHSCLLRSVRCDLQYSSMAGISLPIQEFRLNKIHALQETSPQVWELAKEILRKKHVVETVSYDPQVLIKEIESQNIGVQYIRRAIKKTDLGIEHIKKSTKNADDPDLVAMKLGSFYNNWIAHDDGLATYYLHWNIRSSISHIRSLHNFVRKNIGMILLGSNSDYPLCFPTVMYFNGYPEQNEYYGGKYIGRLNEFYKLHILNEMNMYNLQELPLE
ncbi:hypothetical protein [Desulfogranum japonicum]|uniref:hypothetical protein n=1 Tax=Desulfogranum japonicum TaxID=231447 RepID=UPI001969BDEF|nr:hypothetical protein [Desulfogranum japonicum]